MLRSKLSFAFLFVFMLSFAAIAQTPASSAIRDERYRIGFQDILSIQVFRHPELTIDATVNPNGVIYLYRLEKPIVAVCKTERELADDIAAAYKVSYLKNPQINVIVREQKSQSMAVIGAVEKPGTFFVSKRVHLLELIAMAGGPNKESGTRVIVQRPGSSTNCKMPDGSSIVDDNIALLGFKMRDVQEGKKTLWMQPGDVVSVMDADTVYVYGNVIKPGEVRFREPITLRQAIASSEGLKPATEKNAVRILRQIPDSIERTELVFDLNAIDKGKASDPYLEPNDIVAISKDGTKDILNGILKTITNGIPTILSRGIPVL
ncbi:MAG: SLBB domain-containing protein [Pyrinomonadaceae bacterium]|nr:SLBB domain-containing protein [Pyrinomonadaceae bacterium]MBP6212779.1 SLBB domain-containing protein [Pyrinomonadaceae bacterium]